MKIIFLNIDGVLSNDNHTYHYGNNYIDYNLLNLFAAIVKSTSNLFVTDPELGLTEVLALDIIDHMNYAYQTIN
jgi:hypothetical protein